LRCIRLLVRNISIYLTTGKMPKDNGENTQNGWVITLEKVRVTGRIVEDKVSNVKWRGLTSHV